MRVHKAGANQFQFLRLRLFLFCGGVWKRPNPRRLFADYVAIHRLQQLVARGVGGKVQLRVQSIELEHVVMQRSGAGARPEIAWMPATCRESGTISSSVGEIVSSQCFGQALRGPRDIECGPM